MNVGLISAIFFSLVGIGMLICSRGEAQRMAKAEATRPPLPHRSWWNPIITERQFLIVFRAIGAITLLSAFYRAILFVVN